MITNGSHENAYPISCLTWLLIYREQSYENRSIGKAKNTVKLMAGYSLTGSTACRDGGLCSHTRRDETKCMMLWLQRPITASLFNLGIVYAFLYNE